MFGRCTTVRMTKLMSTASVTAACLAALAGCGSSSTATSSSAQPGTSSAPAATTSAPATTASSGAMSKADATATLAKLRHGVFEAPPATGPKAAPGKHIYYVSYGQQFPTASVFGAALVKADDALGWKTTIIDGQGNLGKINTGIQQAATAHADGIVTAAADCPSIKSGLLAAKAAHVPVVNYAGLDCNAPTFGSGAALFTASLNTMGSNMVTSYYAVRGKAIADYILARVAEQGVSSPKILAFQNLDQAGHKAGWTAFDQEVKAKCPSCTLTINTFTVAQVPNPAAQNWRTEIQAHPDANAIAFDDGAWLTSGLAADLKAVAKPNQIACCSNTVTPFDFQLIRNGTIAATAFWPLEYDGWATADTLNRLFSGVKPADLPNQGGGFFYIDKSNLPAAGSTLEPPVDYKAIREKVWKGQ